MLLTTGFITELDLHYLIDHDFLQEAQGRRLHEPLAHTRIPNGGDAKAQRGRGVRTTDFVQAHRGAPGP